MAWALLLATWANGRAQGFGQLYREGALVATVMPDGWIQLTETGAYVGRVEARGDVFRGGQLVGAFDASGLVFDARGAILGRLDPSGQVLREGLPVGRIDPTGLVYAEGRLLGEAQNVSPRVAAAFFFFFFTHAPAPPPR